MRQLGRETEIALSRTAVIARVRRLMSSTRNYPIHCPKCRHGWDVALHESINVQAEPELREKLIRNEINAVTCPGCSFAFRVDKPLLYSDPARKLMVYWFPARRDGWEEGEERFTEWLREAGLLLPAGDPALPEVHLVFSRVELIERVFMREADLNVRVIEYVKYLIYSRNAGRIEPETKSILFNAKDSTAEQLFFVVLDETSRTFESAMHYARPAYDALAKTFSSEDKAVDLLEMFPGPHISARALLLEELREQALDSESTEPEEPEATEPPEPEED